MDLLEYLGRGREDEPLDEPAKRFVAFADWSAEELRSLLELGEFRDLAPGEPVLVAGTEGDRDLFIVVKGELEACRAQDGSRLGVIAAGHLFGEMSFVDALPRSADVRALTATRVLRIGPNDLDRFAEQNPRLGLAFMREIGRILSHRLRLRQRPGSTERST